MKAQVNGDMVIAMGADIPGIDVPVSMQNLSVSRLRFDGSAIIDAAQITTFFIDDVGQKHIASASGRQELGCAWNDELINGNGVWRVKSEIDNLAEIIDQTERKINAMLKRVYTDNTVRAVLYERKHENALAFKNAGYPDPADENIYPYIVKEAPHWNLSNQGFADLVISKADGWTAFGAGVEAVRAKMKKDMPEAVDETSRKAIASAAIADVETLIGAI